MYVTTDATDDSAIQKVKPNIVGELIHQVHEEMDDLLVEALVTGLERRFCELSPEQQARCSVECCDLTIWLVLDGERIYQVGIGVRSGPPVMR